MEGIVMEYVWKETQGTRTIIGGIWGRKIDNKNDYRRIYVDSSIISKIT